jgi:hypothetical protein
VQVRRPSQADEKDVRRQPAGRGGTQNYKVGRTKDMRSFGSLEESTSSRSSKISSRIAPGSRDGELTLPAPPRPVCVT